MNEIDANAIVDQTIADLDAIESAIEEKGVDVPEDTPTSEYGDKVRGIISGDIAIDQTYRPTSTNAQSGKAVAEAVATEREYASLIANNVYQGIANMGSQIQQLGQDVEGLQQRLLEESHFRGYLSTNAKIQAIEATPNDFAYSAESGTKWVYDTESGWIDTGTPVPDQLTPASNATPLMNGVATAGQSEEYARGDHRHPTDETRVSVEEFNLLKLDIETALDNIIAIQNSYIGGESV
jgi:hypothetical protein